MNQQTDRFHAEFSPAIGFLEWCRDVRNRSPETIRCYSGVLEALADWAAPRAAVDLTVNDLEAFVNRPRGGRAHGSVGSPATRKKDTACLRSFYGWCEDRGLVERAPTRQLHAPTVHNEAPKPIPDDDWRVIWAQDWNDDMLALLGLGYFGGLRRSEIVRLRPENITPTRIVDFTRKGGSQGTVPLQEMVDVIVDGLPHLADGVDRLQVALTRLRKADGPLMPWATTTPSEVNKRVDRWVARLNLPRFTPHQLRHSTATNLLRAGVPLHLVSRLMNHTNTATTMRYVRAGGDELREWRRRGA